MPPIDVSARSDGDLLTNSQAAAYLGVSAKTLPVWRTTHRYGVPFIRIGRLIRYHRRDLDAWLEARTRRCDEDIR